MPAPLPPLLTQLDRLGWKVTFSKCLNPGAGWTLWLASARQGGDTCNGAGLSLEAALDEVALHISRRARTRTVEAT